MSPHQTLAVAVRLFSIWLAAYSFRDIVIFYLQGGDPRLPSCAPHCNRSFRWRRPISRGPLVPSPDRRAQDSSAAHSRIYRLSASRNVARRGLHVNWIMGTHIRCSGPDTSFALGLLGSGVPGCGIPGLDACVASLLLGGSCDRTMANFRNKGHQETIHVGTNGRPISGTP